MMHHPNMHHQPMSGPPPQHMPSHQMPAHHQIQPHQMHRENRMGMGGGQAGGMQLAGGLGALPVPVQHHHAPPAQHHHHHPQPPPPQMKGLRRGYSGASFVPHYAHRAQPPHPPPHPPTHIHHHQPPVVPTATPNTIPHTASVATGPAPVVSAEPTPENPDAGDTGPTQANSKEKTPMCLVNELARYNKIKHQYRLTSETGPAHKRVFTVTLRLGETEEYTAEGSSIKRAQHAAASAALAGTAFPAPPPRPHHAHAHTHNHHRHSVMPTVELNALAMKLCQPAVYASVPPVAGGLPRGRGRGPFRPTGAFARALPPLVYRVRVCVGGRSWLGEGPTPQAARHDAAARALRDLRQPPQPPPADAQPPDPNGTAGSPAAAGENGADLLNSEVKSPVSMVHELALKRNLSVQFAVKSERGPPHMRVFVTSCKVGDMETEGEGNGKKVSKRRAAEKMLAEMKLRWPAAALRPRAPPDARRNHQAKRKPRNLVKEGGVASGENGTNGSGVDNPISRLALVRHAARARSPQYRVLEERGAARRREFLVQCDAPPHAATGRGPNKKTAKRRAAHNVLLAMELANGTANGDAAATNAETSGATSDTNNTNGSGDTKRKESESATGGVAGSEVRQPVPGVLLMDYHQRSGQPAPPNGVSETSATGGAGGSSPGAKDQLMYLSQLLGFTVQFSDFPKRNHGEYLSLVSLSTEPPVMCHGGGPSTAHSHEQCARAALRALALMGLDAPPATAPMQSMSGAGTKPGVISNGISE